MCSTSPWKHKDHVEINVGARIRQRKFHLSGQIFLLVGERIKGPFGTTNFPTRRIKLSSESPLTLRDVWLRLVRVRIRHHHIFAVRKVNLVGRPSKKSIITIKQYQPIVQKSFLLKDREKSWEEVEGNKWHQCFILVIKVTLNQYELDRLVHLHN